MAGYEFAGRYKTSDNYILEEDAQGNRRIRFRPTPAAETKQAMEQLELAYMAARNDGNINQLLLIPCVILDFLCIHPFRDGNGRMSRLLSLLLLYKSNYDVGKYVSFLWQGLPDLPYGGAAPSRLSVYSQLHLLHLLFLADLLLGQLAIAVHAGNQR